MQDWCYCSLAAQCDNVTRDIWYFNNYGGTQELYDGITFEKDRDSE